MKKELLLSLLCQFIFSLQFMLAQCDPGTATVYLDANNVQTALNNDGRLWINNEFGSYFVPKDASPQVSALFSGGIWVGGLTPSGDLRFSGNTYEASYSPGYNSSPDVCTNFNKIWEVWREDVELLIADYEDNGTIDDPVANSILRWPAKGNPFFESIEGFALPEKDLAPFVDLNGDGIYNPEEGDYPKIKGDQNFWWVMNDGLNQTSLPVGVEIQVMAFASASTIEAVNNTTFYEFKIINHNQEDLMELYSSLWIDPDLGCFTDDYIGCLPEENLAFIYNQDAVDGDNGCSCQFGVSTYCEEVPLVGIKVLNASPSNSDENLGLSSFMYYNNSAAGFPSLPQMGDPDIPQQHYNYMKALWKDGTPLTEGNNGYDPNSTQVTNYAFPGDTQNEDEWSMCSTENPPGDFRLLLNAGPVDLAPKEFIELSYAVIYVPGVSYPCPSVDPLVDAGGQIDYFYANLQLTATTNLISSSIGLSLTPNPMEEQSVLRLDAAHQLREVELYSLTGQLVKRYIPNQSNELIIQKGGLAKGVYLCKVLTTEGKTSTRRLVVQ